MPLYEYQCSKCGERFEVIEKFSDEPLKRHKGCRGAVHRLVSSPALHFKGSGFYITDYAGKSRSEGKPESNGESGSESKATESKSSESKSSESKSSESKSESKSGSSESKPSAKESKKESKPAKTP